MDYEKKKKKKHFERAECKYAEKNSFKEENEGKFYHSIYLHACKSIKKPAI